MGICLRGVRECVAGRWGGCTGQRLPEAQETCNQTDDDCDGDIDEAFLKDVHPLQSQPGEPVARGPAHGQAFEEPAANSGLERDDDGNIVLVPGEAGEQLTTNSLWIANAGEGTVSKVDTDLLRERPISVHWSQSSGFDPHADQSPSRTAIDLAGKRFVANRNSGARAPSRNMRIPSASIATATDESKRVLIATAMGASMLTTPPNI